MQHFETVAELERGPQVFNERFNQQWLASMHAYRTPTAGMRDSGVAVGRSIAIGTIDVPEVYRKPGPVHPWLIRPACQPVVQRNRR